MVLKVESYRRGIVISTVLNIVNKGLVFFNSLLIAYFFGAQLKMDIYFYSYNTIIILAAFISNLNAAVIIPESMRLRTQEGEAASMRFFNFFLALYTLITLAIVAFFVVSPVYAFTLISSFSKEALHQQVSILLLTTPLIFLIPIVNLLTDILGSYKFFSMPMIIGISNGIFSILFVVFFHNTLDVLSLLLGLLFSYSLNLGLLLVLMKRRLKWSFTPKKVSLGKRVWKNILFAQAGNITSSLSTYAPLYLLSGFSAGIITSLNFAQQISALPSNLITTQFSSVAGIKFNELNAQQDSKGLNHIFLTTTGFLIFILTPVSAIFFLYPESIVTLLFKRGAFNEQSITICAVFLKYLGLLLPMLAINTMGARLFMATHHIKQAFWFQVILNTALIILIYVGIRRFEIYGYLGALLSIYVLSTFLQIILFRIILPAIKYEVVIGQFLKCVLLNFLIGLAVYGITSLFNTDNTSIVGMFAGIAIYGVLFIAIASLLKLNAEFQRMFGQALALVKKKSAVVKPQLVKNPNDQ